METSYYIFSNGSLKRKDNNITIETSERSKDLKIEITRDIFLFGEMNLNSKCLNFLGQNKIALHFFNYYGFYTGSFYPKEINVSGNLLIKQVEFYSNLEKRLEIAKEIIEGASHNIFRNLRYYNGRGKDLEREIGEINYLRERIEDTENISELMGIEGNIRKIYYSAWNKIINQEINFEKRVKHPPDNMINTLISFINSLMYVSCLSEIYVTQLNPTISYLHSASDRRFSLCLDISEIFKPLIADRLIFTLLNKNIITEEDFEKESNFFYLKERGRRKILELYDERLKQVIKHKDLGRNTSYRYLIRLECFKLIKHLLNEKNMKVLRCGGKMYVILVYDIRVDENGSKVSRNIFKIAKKYLTHIQNSVFEGELTPALLKKMEMEIKKYVRKDLDSIIIFRSREQRWLEKEFWGYEDDKTSNFF